MSKSKLLGRYSAMESDVPDDAVINSEVDETGAQLDGTEIVEGDMVEAAADHEDIVETDGNVEELQETSDALEAWLDEVKQARISRTGLTKREARLIFVGLNNEMIRHGHTVDDMVEPHNVSVESFDGGRDSLGRCDSLEGAIMDAIRQFWEKIKQQISKMVKSVREWWAKHLDVAGRMKKRAEALREKANATNGTAKEKKISLGVHRQLSNLKAVGTDATVSTGLKACSEVLGSLTASQANAAYKDNLTGFEATVDKIFDKATIAETADIAIDSSKIPSGSVAGIGAQNGYSAYLSCESGEAFGTAALPGHKAFMTIQKSTGKHTDPVETQADSLKASAEASRIVVKYTSEKVPEIDGSKDYVTLAPSAASALCGDVIKLCDIIINYKQNFDKYEAANKQFLSKMDGISKKTIKEDGVAADNAKIGRIVSGAAAAYVKNRIGSITNVMNYSVGLGRATLVYVQQSLAQYKNA